MTKTVSSGRAITSTNIAYGLAKIPVSISTMIDKVEGTSLSGICPDCKGSIGNIAQCKECDKRFTSNRDPTLLKAYKFSDDEQIIVSAEQRENLKNFDSQILVLGTINHDDLDIRSVSAGYYLTPKKSKKKTDNQRAYLTIFEGLKNSDKVVIVKFSVRTTQKLGVLIPYFNVKQNTKAIILKELAYGEQLRQFDLEYDEEQIPTESEEEQGMNFINSLKSINPHEIQNDFTIKFEEILKGETVEIAEPTQQGSSMDMFKICVKQES